MATQREEYLLSVGLDLSKLRQQVSQLRGVFGQLDQQQGAAPTPTLNTAPYKRMGQEAGRAYAQGFQQEVRTTSQVQIPRVNLPF